MDTREGRIDDLTGALADVEMGNPQGEGITVQAPSSQNIGSNPKPKSTKPGNGKAVLDPYEAMLRNIRVLKSSLEAQTKVPFYELTVEEEIKGKLLATSLINVKQDKSRLIRSRNVVAGRSMALYEEFALRMERIKFLWAKQIKEERLNQAAHLAAVKLEDEKELRQEANDLKAYDRVGIVERRDTLYSNSKDLISSRTEIRKKVLAALVSKPQQPARGTV